MGPTKYAAQGVNAVPRLLGRSSMGGDLACLRFLPMPRHAGPLSCDANRESIRGQLVELLDREFN